MAGFSPAHKGEKSKMDYEKVSKRLGMPANLLHAVDEKTIKNADEMTDKEWKKHKSELKDDHIDLISKYPETFFDPEQFKDLSLARAIVDEFLFRLNDDETVECISNFLKQLKDYEK